MRRLSKPNPVLVPEYPIALEPSGPRDTLSLGSCGVGLRRDLSAALLRSLWISSGTGPRPPKLSVRVPQSQRQITRPLLWANRPAKWMGGGRWHREDGTLRRCSSPALDSALVTRHSSLVSRLAKPRRAIHARTLPGPRGQRHRPQFSHAIRIHRLLLKIVHKSTKPLTVTSSASIYAFYCFHHSCSHSHVRSVQAHSGLTVCAREISAWSQHSGFCLKREQLISESSLARSAHSLSGKEYQPPLRGNETTDQSLQQSASGGTLGPRTLRRTS